MNELISIVSANPGMAGFILFVIVFLPLLAYVIRWAEKSTNDLKSTYENVLDKADQREERLTMVINVTLSDTTKVLGKMEQSLTMIHENMCNLTGRVESIEKNIEKGDK